MIIARISHGLGNQMFQYAAGRSMAETNHTTLKLDLTHYDKYQDRFFGLNHFNLPVTVATEQEIVKLNGCPPGERKRGLARHWSKIVKILTPGNKRHVLREKHREYDAKVLQTRGDIYMMGYWQCYRYFDPIKEIIRKEFTLRNPPSPENQCWLEEITRAPSVAVHIRRGDYVNHPVLEMKNASQYYDQALSYILARVKDLRIFVFSDDPEWVSKNLKYSAPLFYVKNNKPSDCQEDMRLMSACQHQVIANSTFSWWAAWLNPNPNKLICCPKTWFNHPTRLTGDLIPEGWNVI